MQKDTVSGICGNFIFQLINRISNLLYNPDTRMFNRLALFFDFCSGYRCRIISVNLLKGRFRSNPDLRKKNLKQHGGFPAGQNLYTNKFCCIRKDNFTNIVNFNLLQRSAFKKNFFIAEVICLQSIFR